MKKIFHTFALVLAFIVWQGCGSKTKENAEETTDSVTAAAEEAKKKEADAVARRERIAKERAERAEQRRLAYEEMIKTTPTYKDASGVVVYNKAEVDPSYTGGEEAMVKYLTDNMQYPQEAKDKGVEGTVFVDFVVSANGKVREAVATDAVGQDVDQTLKDEAVRVVVSMPGWVAGRQRGKAVDVKYSLPVTFQMTP